MQVFFLQLDPVGNCLYAALPWEEGVGLGALSDGTGKYPDPKHPVYPIICVLQRSCASHLAYKGVFLPSPSVHDTNEIAAL